MRTAHALLSALSALSFALALPAVAQVSSSTPLQPINPEVTGAVPAPPGVPSPNPKAPNPAAVAKEAAGAAGALPAGAVPTFTFPPKTAPAAPAGSALKLPDPNAPLTNPVKAAPKVVAPPTPGSVPPGVNTAAPGMLPMGVAPSGMAPPRVIPPTSATGTTTTVSSSPGPTGGVVMVPGTGGSQTRTADGMVTTTGAGSALGDNGLPPTPNYPPTPLMNELPGLGKAPGTQQPGKPLVVRSVAGVNDIVPVSRNFPNRIATPFADPVWVDQGTANIDKLHGSVFVTPKSDRAIQLFITENNDPNAAVVQLTLLPRAIPGQTLVVQIEGFEGAAKKSNPAVERERESRQPNEYTEQMLFLLREVARNRAPAGFTEEVLQAPVANLPGGVQVLPDKRYSGSVYDIYKYRLRNAGGQRITLSEQSFYQKGVRAVSFYPLLQLAGGQETSVHIITSKDGE